MVEEAYEARALRALPILRSAGFLYISRNGKQHPFMLLSDLQMFVRADERMAGRFLPEDRLERLCR